MGLSGSLLGQLGDPCMIENHWKDSQPVKASPSTETSWDSELPLIWWKLWSLSSGGKVALNFRSLSINICSKYSKTHSKMKPRNWDTLLHQVKVLYQMCSGIIHQLAFRATSVLAVGTLLSTHALQMRLCGRDFSLWPQYSFYTSLKELFLFGLLCIFISTSCE